MDRRAFGRTAFHTALMMAAPGLLPALARASTGPASGVQRSRRVQAWWPSRKRLSAPFTLTPRSLSRW